MAIWLLRESDTTLSADQAYLLMPPPEHGGAWPDFTGLASASVKARLREAMPDLPPEEYARLLERLNYYLADMHKEDIVLLFSPAAEQISFLEITGHCRLMENRYALPVQRLKEGAPLRKFRAYAAIIRTADHWPRKIEDAKLRTAVRDYLRMPGTRFAGWKWIIGLLILLRLAMYIMQEWKRDGAGF